jgi:hypothetical protein
MNGMDLLGLLSAIWRRKLLATMMIAVAAFAAVATAYKIPSLEERTLSVGAATSQILVDSNPSTLVAGAGTDKIASLGSRARVYAQYLSSRDAIDQISKETGIPPLLITARGPFSQGTGIKNYQQQPAESRARDLVDEKKSYRLVFEAQEDVPIITVYATGPSSAAALALAQSAFKALKGYVSDLERQGTLATDEQPVTTAEDANTAQDAANNEGISPDGKFTGNVIVVRQLGAPEGGTVGGSADKAMMLMAFLAVLGFQAFFAALVIRAREQRQAAALSEAINGNPAMMRPDLVAEPEADEAPRTEWARAGYLRR